MGRGWTRWRIVGVILAAAAVSGVTYYVLFPPNHPAVNDGSAAPDFSFTTPSGGSSQLSAYVGHPLVLWWVATWCSSCQLATQVFAQQYLSQYENAHVLLLEMEDYNDLGQSGPSISAMASAYGYHGQSGWVLGVGSSSGTSTYNPQDQLDYYYVISGSGVIVSQGAGLGGNFAAALSAATGG